MKNTIVLLLSILVANVAGCAQSSSTPPDQCTNPAFDKKIKRLLRFTVPTLSPQQVKELDAPLLLDAREREEYDISHLPNAQHIGYRDFDKSTLTHLPKDTTLVVYCSIGYRSEKIGEQLQKMGFTNVYNLYGSIFEWVNQGNIVVDTNNNPTKRIHTYNRAWSKWMENGEMSIEF